MSNFEANFFKFLWAEKTKKKELKIKNIVASALKSLTPKTEKNLFSRANTQILKSETRFIYAFSISLSSTSSILEW